MTRTFFHDSLWNDLIGFASRLPAPFWNGCLKALPSLGLTEDDDFDLSTLMSKARNAGLERELAEVIDSRVNADEALRITFGTDGHALWERFDKDPCFDLAVLNLPADRDHPEVRKLARKLASQLGKPCRLTDVNLPETIKTGVAVIVAHDEIAPAVEAELRAVADIGLLQRRAIIWLWSENPKFPVGSERLRRHQTLSGDTSSNRTESLTVLFEDLCLMAKDTPAALGRVVLGNAHPDYLLDRLRLRMILAEDGVDVRPLGHYLEHDHAVQEDLRTASFFVQMLPKDSVPSAEMNDQALFAAASAAQTVRWYGAGDGNVVTEPGGVTGSLIGLRGYLVDHLKSTVVPSDEASPSRLEAVKKEFDLLALYHEGDPALEITKAALEADESSFLMASDVEPDENLRDLALRAESIWVGAGFLVDKLRIVLTARKEKKRSLNATVATPLVEESNVQKASGTDTREQAIADGLDKVKKEWRAQTSGQSKPVKVFYIHANANDTDLTRLLDELTTFRIRNIIADWDDHQIIGGDPVHQRIFENLVSADEPDLHQLS